MYYKTIKTEDGKYKTIKSETPIDAEPNNMTAYCWRCEYRTGSDDPVISYAYFNFAIAPEEATDEYLCLRYEGDLTKVEHFNMTHLYYGKTSDTEFRLMDRDIWTYIREPENDFTLWQSTEEP